MKNLEQNIIQKRNRRQERYETNIYNLDQTVTYPNLQQEDSVSKSNSANSVKGKDD